MEKLEICRDLIDSIDNQIIELYVKRMEIVKEITKLKIDNNLPVLDQNREKIMLEKNLGKIKNDELSFPIVALFRESSNEDTELSNFTRLHRGVTTIFDTQTNQYFYEKSIPWQLSYSLTILTTNQADVDELMRELLFKSSSLCSIFSVGLNTLNDTPPPKSTLSPAFN